jgi:hypothetical protein
MRLVLIRRAAVSRSRMRPVNFIGLANLIILAILPIVSRGELGIILVIVMALKTLAHFTREAATLVDV